MWLTKFDLDQDRRPAQRKELKEKKPEEARKEEDWEKFRQGNAGDNHVAICEKKRKEVLRLCVNIYTRLCKSEKQLEVSKSESANNRKYPSLPWANYKNGTRLPGRLFCRGRLCAKIGMLVKFCDLMRSRSFEIEVCQVDLLRWTNEDLTRIFIVKVISDNLSTNQNFLYVYFSNFK